MPDRARPTQARVPLVLAQPLARSLPWSLIVLAASNSVNNPLAQLIFQGAQARGLDPRAVLAVAAQEGLGGGIGDQGTSFGPFQLHYGGAYPSTAPQGAQASQQWATSPAGVGYALDAIARVAAHLKGAQAIQAIVSQFERPANVGREVAGASAAYGELPALPPTGPGLPPGIPQAAQASPPQQSSFLPAALLAQILAGNHQTVFGGQ